MKLGGSLSTDDRASPSGSDELKALVYAKIENLRPKLLDLSRRNPLVSTRLSGRSNSYIRAVDELPDVLFFGLSQKEAFRFDPLPPLDEDPKDERTDEFERALSEARLTDEVYSEALEQIEADDEEGPAKQRQAERALRDRVREQLGMAPRQTRHELSLERHARNNHVSPSYELPTEEEEHEDGRHTDDAIQTLLLPDDLERTANRLISKCRSWQQETGLNVMHAAFGFLEWQDATNKDRSFSPLVLVPVEIERKKTRDGPEFWISGTGEPGEMNNVLAEKLRLEQGIDLPPYEGGSIEEYLSEVADAAPKKIEWRVRRYAAFGVFPSSRLAMYYDLETGRKGFSTNGMVDELLAGKAADGAAGPYAEEYEVDDPAVEKKVPLLVTDADSSQFSTMVDVTDGKNLAVEGPPGTGKSQTIINTIAAAMARGKKVLFVAEKLAALDVVRSRLEHMQLGEFVLPLQASRSSREQVVNSVRDRINIARTGAPKDYDTQIDKFRSTRDEIARYIQLITQPYKDTGFTVHDLLGRSILTGGQLENLPRTLQAPEIARVEAYDRERIDQICDIARVLEDAWRQAQAAAGYWSDVSLSGIDRFTADSLLNQATDAAELYRDVDTARRALAGHEVPDSADVAAIREFEGALRTLAEQQNLIDGPLVDSLVKERRVEELRSLLDECAEYRDRYAHLDEFFEAPFDETFAAQLREIQNICEANGFDTLDLAALKQRRDREVETIRKGEHAESELGAFLEEVPSLAGHSIGMLARARRTADEYPREILRLRNEITADQNAPPVIERGIQLGSALRDQRSELAERFAIDLAPNAGEIARWAGTLRTAGALGFLSADYRSAKKAYRSLFKSRKYRKEQAAEDLDRLAEWKAGQEQFLADQQLRTVFGLQFNGLDTDFGQFQRLLDYFEDIDQQFSGVGARDVRKFLKTADLDLLLSTPLVDLEDLDVPYGELPDELKRRRSNLDAMNDGIERLEALLTRVKRPERTSPASLYETADLVERQLDRGRNIETSPLRDLLAARFAGVETMRETFTHDLDAADLLEGLPQWSQALGRLLSEGRTEAALDDVQRFFQALSSAESATESLCDKIGVEPSAFLPEAPYNEIADHLGEAAADREGLNAHTAYFGARKEIDATGLGQAVRDLLQGGHGLNELPQILEAMLVRTLSMKVYEDLGDQLNRYTGAKLDDLRSRVALLDEQIIEASRKHLRAKLIQDARPSAGVGQGRKSTWTEMSLLNNEINKQRGYYPVRDVIKRARKSLLELKPCWMMSPLSIAQYLEQGAIEFDLCIIDEASQMPPENALGGLLRAKQTMIVGDTNQLPPTSFFRKMIADEDADEDETVIDESILEMANATFRPPRRLRWHYRSRHSGLIRYSNRMVYDDDLIVFPSATEDREDMGVSLVKVDGTYKSGTNPTEARVMVERALRFMREDPERSLGIVTLNQKQRDLIQEEMDYALGRDSKASDYIDRWAVHRDGLESFFIKNLENVQGDERDVIFIGTVYGPEKPGAKVHQRFGPINGVAGKRRLNVLFSRAKQQIMTFSSMTAADITADEQGNPGAYMLKRWLEYSASGVLDAGEVSDREPDSDFEEFVAQQVRSMGCEPVHQVGVAGYFIDIGIRHPEWPHGYLLGVECDGATYHSSRSARDRDRLRQQVLEGLGWHLHRIWSTDWFNDPRSEAEKLRRRIEERLEEERRKGLVVEAGADEEQFVEEEHRPTSDYVDLGEVKSEEPALPLQPKARQPVARNEIEVGDTVRVRYLSGDMATLMVTLSDQKNDPANGIVHVGQPLAKALLGAEPEEEIEVLIGSRVRPAIIEEIRKSEIA